MAETASAADAAALGRAPRPSASRAAAERSAGAGCCPSSGPLLLFIVWDLVVRLGLIKADPAADAAGDDRARWSPASPAGRCCSTSASPCCARCRRS